MSDEHAEDERRRLMHVPKWDSPFLQPDQGNLETKRWKAYLAWYREVRDRRRNGAIQGEVVGWSASGLIDSRVQAAMPDGVTLGVFAFSLVHDADRVLTIFPAKPIPALNHPYRILSCTVFNQSVDGQTIPLVSVDEWEEVEAVGMYVDSDVDAPGVTKFMAEELGDDLTPLELNALVYSVMGSPGVREPGGGVAVQGLYTSQATALAQSFADLELVLPPPMRGHQKRAVTAVGESKGGVALHLTTKLPPSGHHFQHTQDDKGGAFAKRVSDARQVAGDRSFVGAIQKGGGTARLRFDSILHGALKSDLLYPSDLDLTFTKWNPSRFLSGVTDHHWAAIASARTIPIHVDVDSRLFDDAMKKVREGITAAVEINSGLKPSHFERSIAAIIPRSRDALVRVAHASARSQGHQAVGESHVQLATRQIEKAIAALMERAEVRRELLDVFAKQVPSDRYQAIAQALLDHPDAAVNDVYSVVKNERDGKGRPLFRDAADLLGMLDWGYTAGHWTRLAGRYNLA